MKKLIALLLSVTLMMSGCVVATHETKVVPVMLNDGTEVPAYTFYGESVAPIRLMDKIAGRSINVIDIDIESANKWVAEISKEDEEALKKYSDFDDYIAKFIAQIEEAKATLEAEEAKKAAADAPAVKLEEAAEAEGVEIASWDLIFDNGDAEEITEEELAALEELSKELDALFASDSAISSTTMALDGLEVATYLSTIANKRITARYPGQQIVRAYTVLMSDKNGLYPAKGGPVNIPVAYDIPEGEKANNVLIITSNRVISNRHATVEGSELRFTIPSTPSTLVLITTTEPVVTPAATTVPAMVVAATPAATLVPATPVATPVATPAATPVATPAATPVA